MLGGHTLSLKSGCVWKLPSNAATESVFLLVAQERSVVCSNCGMKESFGGAERVCS